ncbi:Sensor histidine kinase TmoS [Paenibacillus konkukensis]|uniref:histidine kinase n=1 Tax=Paenibacillus konkukensis TaxID=2020716 RepID=A0ABY4RGE4_9BACL|nr:Sensor histidine kinase TmoS [Paenibacillus konkukensis]
MIIRKYRNLLLCILLFGLLFSLRGLLWSGLLFPVDRTMQAEDGVIDLRGQNWEKAGPMTLNGEWAWYPGRLLSHEELQSKELPRQTIQVPGNWGMPSSLEKAGDDSAYGYGTYRLRILIDPLKSPIAFSIRSIKSSSEAEVNGEAAGMSGTVAADPEEYKPDNIPYTAVYYKADVTEIELLLRVANYDSPMSGGLVQPVLFGLQSSIESTRTYSIDFQMMTVLIMLLHGLYGSIVYAYKPQNRSLLVSGLIYVAVALVVANSHDKVLAMWLPLNYTWNIKIRILAVMVQNYAVLYLHRKFAGIQRVGVGFKAYTVMLLCLGFGTLFLPISMVNRMLDTGVYLLSYLIPLVWFVGVVWKMVFGKTDDQDIHFILITAVCIVSNLMWTNLDNYVEVSSVYYPFDLTIALIAFSVYWFKKYIRNSDDVERLYEQLKVSDRMKDQFLANTSHELRTPLHGIMNLSNSVYTRELDKLEDDSRQALELVGKVSRRMSRLLDDLLDLAQLREHRIILHPEPLNLHAIVPGVASMLKYIAESKPVRFRLALATSLPPVWADEKRLVQILYNLLHNAFKFTEEGEIVVSAELLNGQIEIRVADTGIGMDEETLSSLFVAYMQGTHNRGDGRGLGLGMNICKELVELHGSELFVQSEPGCGSTFFFRLPVADGAAERAADAGWHEAFALEAAATVMPVAEAEYRFPDDAAGETDARFTLSDWLHSPDNPIHILIVDDDLVNLDVLAGILSTEPYSVTKALSGHQALELLAEGEWDLLIADVMMPGMSGYELTEKVRERRSVSELPVLLLTARGQPADMYTGFLVGANDYVTKPADAMELKYRIRSLIALKRSMSERLRMEAAYLQAQIKPHFLFNTINSLIALGDIDTEKMRQIGDAFATFLRISFDYSNTRAMVDLEHELELVRSYLYIEQERFGERLSVVQEIEPGISLLLPPLSIQPLVENAVRHGILKRAKGGTLRLRVGRTANGVSVEVQDDGVGMASDLIERLLNRSDPSRSGIGIANTHRRLLQMYGQGLSIRSVPGEGTVVSFTIPQQP